MRVALLFSDTAREVGTGYGGLSFIRRRGKAGKVPKPTMLSMAEQWNQATRHDLQTKRLSMPAGEAPIGVIIMIDAMARELEGLTHLVAFTDSDPAAAALNMANSPSPHIDCLERWLATAIPGYR